LRRITKAALGGLAGCALALGGTQAASGDLLDILKVHGDSGDFLTSTDQPLDSAKAKITIDKAASSTTFKIRVTGIDTSIAGSPMLGAHLHTGDCVEGDISGNPPPGGKAGPHYNDDVAHGRSPAMVNTDTEVWFDLAPNEEGMAYDETTVPFVPVDVDRDHVMAVVVHVNPTNTDPAKGTVGGAGMRQACFPLSVGGIFPTE
jgi:Cu/Zn superoxide dismutase